MSPSRKTVVTISAALHLALASGAAMPQAPSPGARPARVDAATLLNLDATRAAQVDAILQASREKMRALHQQAGRPADAAARSSLDAATAQVRAEADQQLAAVLTPEELAKLRDALPRPRK
jgi:Spy/CpxP family protein refolding chaperone